LLTDPIFTSTGEPYRIAEVHCPGADNIEITFRRPFDQFRNKGLLDEKIYVLPCGGTSDPFAALGALFETTGVQPVLDDRIRPR
jgi:hypothetical protein